MSELQHFGVKGMKWGVHNVADAVSEKTGMQITGRQKATGKQIKAARKRLEGQSKVYKREFRKYDKLADTSTQKKQLEASLRKREQAYLKSPDRVIANRLTTGEKFLTAYFAAGTGGLGAGVAASTIATTSAVSRRIEYKQKHGAYNKAPTGKVKSSIGAQKARKFALTGAALLPGILQVAGQHASSAIITKAAANRNAAAAGAKVLKIGATAAKTSFAKQGLRGAYKITTMK
jgi:hypothetical protein